MHRRSYSLQCSDKIRFPQLRTKCGVAKSCTGTHTALQALMMVATVDILIKHCGYVELALVSTVATSITRGKVQVEGKEGKRREGG